MYLYLVGWHAIRRPSTTAPTLPGGRRAGQLHRDQHPRRVGGCTMPGRTKAAGSNTASTRGLRRRPTWPTSKIHGGGSLNSWRSPSSTSPPLKCSVAGMASKGCHLTTPVACGPWTWSEVAPSSASESCWSCRSKTVGGRSDVAITLPPRTGQCT